MPACFYDALPPCRRMSRHSLICTLGPTSSASTCKHEPNDPRAQPPALWHVMYDDMRIAHHTFPMLFPQV